MNYTYGLKKSLREEGIEYIVSMLMEPYDSIVNPLVEKMSSEEDLHFDIPGERLVSDLESIIIQINYSNILEIDFNSSEGNCKFLVHLQK